MYMYHNSLCLGFLGHIQTCIGTLAHKQAKYGYVRSLLRLTGRIVYTHIHTDPWQLISVSRPAAYTNINCHNYFVGRSTGFKESHMPDKHISAYRAIWGI